MKPETRSSHPAPRVWRYVDEALRSGVNLAALAEFLPVESLPADESAALARRLSDASADAGRVH